MRASSASETVKDMKLSINAEISLGGPHNYITWFDVCAYEHTEAEAIATARVALVHVGEILDAEGELWPALRDTRLESLHDVYFAQEWYRDEFADGAGIDLMVIDDVTIDATRQDRNLDLAIVRRLCDTIGSGSQIAVMAYRNALEATIWARLGFLSSTPGRPSGWLHLKLGQRNARVVSSGPGTFEVLPTTIRWHRPSEN